MTAIKPRKALFHQTYDQGQPPFQFADETWVRLTGSIPSFGGRPVIPMLDLCHWGAFVNDGLRHEIEIACGFLLFRDEWDRHGQATAAAMRRPGGKGQLAPLERYAKATRKAAEAWQEVRDVGYWPPVGGEGVAILASAAERLLDELHLEKPTALPPAWPIFVRTVAKVLRDYGFEPKRNGRAYCGGKPGWFQTFMRELNKALPDNVRHVEHSKEAFDASVTAALSKHRGSQGWPPQGW
jgi:hypothetical protein